MTLLQEYNILNIIKESNTVERFVYASSSLVYGDFKEIPASEDHLKFPKDIYGGTKLAGEILTETYGRRYGIGYTIIRPSAVYGPTDINRRVIQIFIENAIKEESIVVHGAKENVLDFTFVEDCANGFVLAAFSDNGKNEVFNITRGEGRCLEECVEIIKGYFPDLKFEYREMRVDRAKRGALSINKAKDLLGYEPQFSLEEGIKKYIGFYQQYGRY